VSERRLVHVRCKVDWNWSGSRVASKAEPTVSYSIAATKAPNTLPRRGY
jgi:hypothetical protein